MADDYSLTLDRRQLSLLRLAQSMIKEIANPALNDAYRAARLAILDNDEPRTQLQMQKMRDAMVKAYHAELEKGFAPLTDQMNELSVAEAAFVAKTMKEFAPEAFTTPADKVVARYVERSVMKLGEGAKDSVFTWDDYLNDYFDSSAKNIRNSVSEVWRAQTAEGKLPTLNQYVKRIKLTHDGVNTTQARGVVITGVNHFSTQGRLAFRDDNLDVIGREIPIVTFDSQTSTTCISIAAKYGIKGWPVGKSPIGYNPYHSFCRTGISFLTIGQTKLEGERQAIEGRSGEEAAESFARRTKGGKTTKYSGRKDKAFKGVEIDANTPISKFLLDQPVWFQNKSLGKTKAEAFRAGKLDLTKLTDKDLKPATLADLNLE